MRAGLLTVAQAAKELGVTPQTVRRQVTDGTLASLWFGPRLIRVVARSVREDAPPPLPEGPAHVSADWVAMAWSMHPRTVKRMADAGVLPGLFRGQQWTFRRQELLGFLREHREGRAAA